MLLVGSSTEPTSPCVRSCRFAGVNISRLVDHGGPVSGLRFFDC
jgi:hypothetical protein